MTSSGFDTLNKSLFSMFPQEIIDKIIDETCSLTQDKSQLYQQMSVCKSFQKSYERSTYRNITLHSNHKVHSLYSTLEQFPHLRTFIRSITFNNLYIPLQQHQEDNNNDNDNNDSKIDEQIRDPCFIDLINQCPNLISLKLIRICPPNTLTLLHNAGKDRFLTKLKTLDIAPAQAMVEHDMVIKLVNSSINLTSLRLSGLFMTNGSKSAQSAFSAPHEFLKSICFHDSTFRKELIQFMLYLLKNDELVPIFQTLVLEHISDASGLVCEIKKIQKHKHNYKHTFNYYIYPTQEETT